LSPAHNWPNPHPPFVARAVQAIILPFMGVLFVGGSLLLLRVFLRVQAIVFPYECRLTRDVDGSWTAKQKLWFLRLPSRRLGREWVIWCVPVYSGGDWGYAFMVRSKRAKLVLAPAGVFTDSRRRAEAEALKDTAVLEDLFGVRVEWKGWK
jgi:hypothetical protein